MTKRQKNRIRRILDNLGGRSIVLVGMMGCGKSAIGKMLANSLGLDFKDADSEIELAAGRSVADIFSEYGEPEFRRLEERVIARLLEEGPMVLALGGGAFLNADTRRTIEKLGLSIWLKADLETLLERVMRKPGKRPLLKQGDPRETLTRLLKEREPEYAKAEIEVLSRGGSKSDMRNLVLEKLDDGLASQTGKVEA